MDVSRVGYPKDLVGNIDYMAPEIFILNNGEGLFEEQIRAEYPDILTYDYKVDIWQVETQLSLGMSFCRLIWKMHAFGYGKLVLEVGHEQPSIIKRGFSLDLRFILSCHTCSWVA